MHSQSAAFLSFLHTSRKKERKSTYPNEEQTRHWRLPRDGATPVRKKCKITYEENHQFPAVQPRSCAVGAVCSLGGTGIPPRCDGERHLSRGDAPSLSTFRLIFTDTRHKRGGSYHKHGESRLVRADLPCRRNNTRHKRGESWDKRGQSCRKRGKSKHKRADFRHLIAEQRATSTHRCAVEGTDRAAFHRHAPRHARNPHRRRRALPGCARRHRQQRAMHHPFEKQPRPCARRSHLHRLPQTRAHTHRAGRRPHRPRLERRQSRDAKRRGHHPTQTHLRVAAVGRREIGRH